MRAISLILAHDLALFIQSIPVEAKALAVACTIACGGLPPEDPAARPRLTLAREHLLRVCAEMVEVPEDPRLHGEEYGDRPYPPAAHWQCVVSRAGRIAEALLRVDGRQEQAVRRLLQVPEWEAVYTAFSNAAGSVIRAKKDGGVPTWLAALLDGIDTMLGREPRQGWFGYLTPEQDQLRRKMESEEKNHFIAAYAPAVVAARAWCNAFANEIELKLPRPEAGFMVDANTWVYATGFQLDILGVKRDSQVRNVAQAVMDAGHTADRLMARNAELRKEHQQFQEAFKPAKGPDERPRVQKIADREIVAIVREDVREGRDFARSAKYGRR